LGEAVTGERRALVVDDDPGIRVLVTRILTRNGFLVESARDGGEAIEKVMQHDYKLITLDLMMPRIDGFAVLKYLSEHHPAMLANVVVVTAFGSNMIEKIGSSAVRVVEKPFDLNVLLAEATSVADAEPK
jgi:two-component system, response regulator, stage 0 sporulation protein F